VNESGALHYTAAGDERDVAHAGPPQRVLLDRSGVVAARTLYTWPVALSFEDEVGYVGAARMLRGGAVQPSITMPGIWLSAARGLTPKYPFFFSLLIAPLVAPFPRALFVVNVAALLGLTQLARRSLLVARCEPLWALLFLVHPTFVALARTIMADVLLSALAVAAWSLQAQRAPRRTLLLFTLICALKPTGFVIAGALLLARAVQAWRTARPPLAKFLPQQWPACVGALAGAVITLALNWLAHGRVRYAGYSTAMFAPEYLRSAGLAHLVSLLACPPLLLLGAWHFLRRRELGPVFVIATLCITMSTYFFVDHGGTWLESIVLSQRGILPAVAFLLLGYAHLLAELGSRSRWLRQLTLVLVLLPAGSALAIGRAHRLRQDPMAQALRTATAMLDQLGQSELLVTRNASKIGLMFPGPVSVVDESLQHPVGVVLCSTLESYRAGDITTACSLPGYRAVRRFHAISVLLADTSSHAATSTCAP
jgi:hypothetical protein